MAWIESHQELARHPKTKKLARVLEISIPAAIGHLHLLWWWAMDYANDGSLARYDSGDIADAALWEGNAIQFINALCASGFVDNEDDYLVIHDWYDYVGRLIEKRRKDSERKQKEREGSQRVQRTSNGHPMEGAGTVPNLTKPNQTKKIYALPSADVPKQNISNTQPGEQLVATSVAKIERAKTQEELFVEFWKAYPKKRSKGQAEKTWAKLKPDEQLVAIMVAKIEQAKTSEEWTKQDGQFIPYASTWLNAKGWEDEYCSQEADLDQKYADIYLT